MLNPKAKKLGTIIGKIFPCDNPKNIKDRPSIIDTTMFPIIRMPFNLKL